MKAKPFTLEESAVRYLNRLGFYPTDGQMYYAVEDGSRFVCDLRADIVETVKDLEAAGWPTREGEIPCNECGDFQDKLGGLCSRCQANYEGVE